MTARIRVAVLGTPSRPDAPWDAATLIAFGKFATSFVFIMGHSTHETARTVSPSSSIKAWMPLMYLTSMISSSDIPGSFPFTPR